MELFIEKNQHCMVHFELLNDFFSSVFTVEGDSELPDFEQKVKERGLYKSNRN